MSFSSALIRDVILWWVSFAVSLADFLMFLLYVSHSVWMFSSLLSACSVRILVAFDRNSLPWFTIFVIRLSLLRRCIGSVHLPLPMKGASFGAYLTETIEWSDRIADSVISHSKVCRVILSAMYMRSRRACMCSLCVWALYVNALLAGFASLHASWVFHSCLTSLSAVIAASSSSLGGIRSIASSMTLKSPIVKSGIGMLVCRLSVRTFAQKLVCSLC